MQLLNKFLQIAGQRQDLVFAIFFVFIIAMLVIPMPLVIIDTLLAINMIIALIILITATYLKDVLEISTFPSIILITTIYRLALSVSTTRLILAKGDAGHIVAGFGNFVIAGNVVVGLVVFLIIAIVQFMVVTKGAERIAEVSARFTLDAMPGKQMSIDNDLRSGDIDKNEARRRRGNLEKESQFHGAMDGAMRFVKGDAIASLIIVFINLIGGLIIGMLQRGLPLAEAGHLYSLLSVGDGLVAQIPAMLISVAAGAVVTRISDDTSKHLGSDIARQLSHEPKALAIAAFVALGLAALPGFPTGVFIVLSAALGGGSYLMIRAQSRDDPKGSLVSDQQDDPSAPETAPERSDSDYVPLRKTEPGDTLVFRLNPNLFRKLEVYAFNKIVAARREQFVARYGFSSPPVGFATDAAIPQGLLLVELENVPTTSYTIAYEESDQPLPLGALELVGDAIGEQWDVNASNLLGPPELQQWFGYVEGHVGRLASDVQQMIPFMVLLETLRRLLDDGIGLTPPRLLLEGLIQAASRAQDPEAIAELTRTKLRRQICNNVADRDRVISALVVSPDIDDAVRRANQPDRGIPAMRMDEATIKRFIENVKSAAENAGPDVNPVVLCSAEARRIVRKLLVQNGSRIPVLSYADVSQEFQVKTLGVVSAETALAA